MATSFTQTGDSPTVSTTDFARGPAASTDSPFDRILVAVGEEVHEHVVEAAVSLAAAHGVPVDALSIVEMNSSIDHWDMVVEQREADAETSLEAVEAMAEDVGVSVAKRLRYGTPAEEISLYAEHNDTDLIVVGEPNRSGIRKFFSPASVADGVNQSASVPVLTVPTPSE
ncbi:universal stress protein [Haloferax namakaokahaiae]|uniref:Universal stress protein n=1 Tax=Haloferax namakaokahaiae TaxID=1748331 RepID=A0ABD5ZDW9_9EURY